MSNIFKLDTRTQFALFGKTYLFQLKVRTSDAYSNQIENSLNLETLDFILFCIAIWNI